jgi:uncharacterized protein
MADVIEVAVAYATGPGHDLVVILKVAPETTLAEAVVASGILLRHSELGLSTLRLGVWGKVKNTGTTVGAGDRIEIYRGLVVEPNAARLARAAKKSANKGHSLESGNINHKKAG